MPKPIHGWRQFFGEVGIIVIGVLIALGAEQFVHNLTEKRKTAEAQERIRDELGASLNLGIERTAVSPCLQKRLLALSGGLANGRQDWSQLARSSASGNAQLALKEVYHMPSRNWVADAYEGALAQGDLSSASPLERSQLAALYKQIEHIGRLNERENELSTRLAVLQFNPDLSSVERHQMIETVAELDRINALIVLIAQQDIDAFRELRGQYALSAEEVRAARSDWRQYVPRLVEVYGACVDASAGDEALVRLTQGPTT